jgi:hypothetical protein
VPSTQVTDPIVLPDESQIRQRLVALATEMNGLRSLLRVVRRHKALSLPANQRDDLTSDTAQQRQGDNRAA